MHYQARWQEFYKRFARYIPAQVKTSAKKLNSDLDSRGLRIFRNDFLAHIWSREHNRPLTDREVSDTAHKVAGGDFAQFVNWIHDYHASEKGETVVQIVERLRDAFFDAYGLTDRDTSPGLFKDNT